MNNRLAVISTKNPKKEVLIKTIFNIKNFYPEFDIVIIDSDSDDKATFLLAPDECMIEDCKNKNWELGAWYYAFNKYNKYKVYMFIQDSLIPNCRIPNLDTEVYENGTIYTCNYNALLMDGGYIDSLKNVYINTELDFISKLDPKIHITGGAHTFFITNHEEVSKILQLEHAYIEKKIVKTKIDCWLSERTLGIMADKCIKRIDVSPFFSKINCRRDY